MGSCGPIFCAGIASGLLNGTAGGQGWCTQPGAPGAWEAVVEAGHWPESPISTEIGHFQGVPGSVMVSQGLLRRVRGEGGLGAAGQVSASAVRSWGIQLLKQRSVASSF